MTYAHNGHQAADAVNADHAWNPISAETIRRTQFRETPMGRRGLRPDDVEAFLARIALEVDQWRIRYERERAETKRLTHWYRDNGVDVAAPKRRAVTLEATQLLIAAQRQADQLLAEAHQQANHVHSDATRYADELISSARADIERAVQNYRATAGDSYTAEREDLVRWRKWAESLLLMLQAAQANLGVTADELARRLTDIQPQSSTPARPPDVWPEAHFGHERRRPD